MKCPKCDYLGFETSERCKNCGYDFSLLASGAFESSSEPDITIRMDDFTEATDTWLKDLDRALPLPGGDTRLDDIEPHRAIEPLDLRIDAAGEGDEQVAVVSSTEPPPERLAIEFDRVDTGSDDEDERFADVEEEAPRIRSVESPLPLFRANDDDDTPLVTLPPAPRPPLSVRRTPDAPRFRAVSRPRAVEPALDLRDDLANDTEIGDIHEEETESTFDSSPVAVNLAGRRISAAILDNVILLVIDVAVIYFTLRMAGLEPSEWRLIPPVPMAIFLGLMAFTYFTAFTAVGGQTIGKMAAGIRVVGEERRAVDGMAAVRRTLGAIVSYATVGLAYLPGFLGDRRAVHDRIARTRVVARPSA